MKLYSHKAGLQPASKYYFLIKQCAIYLQVSGLQGHSYLNKKRISKTHV